MYGGDPNAQPLSARGVSQAQAGAPAVCGPPVGQGGPELGGWAQEALLPPCTTAQQALLKVPLPLPSERMGWRYTWQIGES